MSEPRRSVPSEPGTLRCIVLIGGGRWSRVLLPVLKSILPVDCKIVWLTQHGLDTAQQWLKENNLQFVEARVPAQFDFTQCDAAVLATAPPTHASYLQQLIEAGVPTFCEKPLTVRADDALRLAELAQHENCPLGVDLVLHYASYLEQFADSLTATLEERLLFDVKMDWFDPWTEQRYGETKHGDFYTNLVHDVWPHCWTVLRHILPALASVQLIDLSYDPIESVFFVLNADQTRIEVRISRRHTTRIRRLNINDGEAFLDFSQEPGWSRIDGIETRYEWTGPRPLTRSLQSFLAVVADRKLAQLWPLAAMQTIDSVRSAELIANRLDTIMLEQIARLRETGVPLEDVKSRNLIVDAQLPHAAKLGTRWPAITADQQTDFVKWFCTENQIRCY